MMKKGACGREKRGVYLFSFPPPQPEESPAGGPRAASFVTLNVLQPPRPPVPLPPRSYEGEGAWELLSLCAPVCAIYSAVAFSAGIYFRNYGKFYRAMYRDDLSRPASAKVIMENVSPFPLANGLVRCLVVSISNSLAFQCFFFTISFYFYAIDRYWMSSKGKQECIENRLIVFFFVIISCVLHFSFLFISLEESNKNARKYDTWE